MNCSAPPNSSAVINLISPANNVPNFQQLFKKWIRHIVISLKAELERNDRSSSTDREESVVNDSIFIATNVGASLIVPKSASIFS